MGFYRTSRKGDVSKLILLIRLLLKFLLGGALGILIHAELKILAAKVADVVVRLADEVAHEPDALVVSRVVDRKQEANVDVVVFALLRFAI